MKRAVTADACTTDRGQTHSGLPPTACGKGWFFALVLGATLVLGAACSSGSHVAQQATVSSTALRIPQPFELGQQVGLGDVSIQATSFRHRGDSLSVVVTATNSTPHSLSLDPAQRFTIFYGAARHAPTNVNGGAAPLAPMQRATIGLEFTVPAPYQYPLLWYSPAASDMAPATIILRGAGSSVAKA